MKQSLKGALKQHVLEKSNQLLNAPIKNLKLPLERMRGRQLNGKDEPIMTTPNLGLLCQQLACVTQVLEPLKTGRVVLCQGPPRQVFVRHWKAGIFELQRTIWRHARERERESQKRCNSTPFTPKLWGNCGNVGALAPILADFHHQF